VARVSPQELEQTLHRSIPLSQAMQVSVLELSDDLLLLGAPLAPNVNHRGTAFGGSVSTLAILSAWSLLYCRLKHSAVAGSVVLQRSSISYDRPIGSAFSACAALAPGAPWALFVRTLERRGKARISVAARLICEAEEVGNFVGEFVAVAAT
jgi:thioesterase domain-containing protein